MTSPVQDVLSYVGTGNADPILREILAALEKLAATGESTVIDLGAIPFAAGDERILDDVLGVGELTATLSALGTSHIAETAIPGVWRIDHLDEVGEVQSRFVEVTTCPEILCTQAADLAIGLDRLGARLAEREEARAALKANSRRDL